jgi:polyisoprenoid-binding protein YceI
MIACLATNVLFAQSNLSVDVTKSIINWTGHADIGTYAPAGTLNVKDGSVHMNAGSITTASITIDMNSMKQDNEHLLEHLKSDDFFNVEKYPESTININRVSNGVAYGQLKIKDKTLPFQCPVLITTSAGPITITGKAVIDRTKFGIIYNSGNFFSGLGDKAIRNTFDIGFVIVFANNK